MENMNIRMTYTDGNIYRWTVRRIPEAFNMTLGKKTRKVSGWEFTSHDGCVRFSEGSWMELVVMFQAVADNYNMTCNIS